jgi:hypothetical protein
VPQHVELGGLREPTTDPAAVYEITMYGAPPVGLTARFPSTVLYVLPAATVLSRRVVDPAEIDALIERLRAIGIAPAEMYASSLDCEFRIEGRLSDSTLRSMQWAARFEEERTMMRVIATAGDLQLILEELAASGIGMDRLIRRHAA